jgi:hypothetical protein
MWQEQEDEWFCQKNKKRRISMMYLQAKFRHYDRKTYHWIGGRMLN